MPTGMIDTIDSPEVSEEGLTDGAGEYTVPEGNGQLAAMTDVPLIMVPANAVEKKLRDEAEKAVDTLARKYRNALGQMNGIAAEVLEWRSTRRYRLLGFENFEDFCHTKFNFTRAQASLLIQDARIRNIEGAGATQGVAGSALRPLYKVDEEKVPEILEEAHKIAAELHAKKVEQGKARADEVAPPPTRALVEQAKDKVLGVTPTATGVVATTVDSNESEDEQGKVYKARTDVINYDAKAKKIVHSATVKIGKVFYRIELSDSVAAFAHIRDIIAPPKAAKGEKKGKPAVSGFTPDADPTPDTDSAQDAPSPE